MTVESGSEIVAKLGLAVAPCQHVADALTTSGDTLAHSDTSIASMVSQLLQYRDIPPTGILPAQVDDLIGGLLLATTRKQEQCLFADALYFCNSAFHLAYSHFAVDSAEFSKYYHTIVPLMKSINNDSGTCTYGLREYRPLRTHAGTSYVISYPRSGNTRLLSAFEAASGSSHYSVFAGDGRLFSRKLYPEGMRSPIFIKDHLYRSAYYNDKCIYVVRDGRDCILSLAYYSYKEGLHQYIQKGQLADFLRFLRNQYLFGFWSDNVRLALDAAARGAPVKIVHYEDFDYGREFSSLLRFAGIESTVPVDEIKRDVKRNAEIIGAGEKWGFGQEMPPGSFLTQEWAQARGSSRWQDCFDRAAAKEFHELGGTDILIELGYERHDDWWRNV